MPEDAKTPQDSPPPQDRVVRTRHSLRVNGAELHCTATAGTVVLREEAEKDGVSEGEKARAELFFIAYTKDAETPEPASRPIVFSFNGGPGSSSVWLHLGLLGPKRVAMDAVGNPTPPPYALLENEHSLLGEADLVFIDPVSTGYSRVLSGETPKDYHDFKKDIESVGDFIRLYLSRARRWSSPKFLIGESYGTTRAAGLSSYLQERHGVNLNGLMLVSSILDFQTARFEPGNDLPYVLFLPTYAATAHYHGKLGELQDRPLPEVLREVEGFALGDYASALLKGRRLGDAERRRVRRKLAGYTGLSEDFLESCNLRVEIMRFTKELRRSERLTVGRLDSRFTGRDRDAAGESPSYDPSYATIQGSYTATFNDYVRRDLGYESDRNYEILGSLYKTWRWSEHENKYINVGENLRRAMSQNPHLRVHVASGYYDLATPYFATEYTLEHLALEGALWDNLSVSYYEAGHMMYVHEESLRQLNQALSAFVRGG